MTTASRFVRLAGNVLLSVSAVVGVCCLLLTLAGALWGVRPLIFRSGSMAPAITAGSLAIAYPVDAPDLRVGDVVSVPVGDIRVAHRIVKITDQGHNATLQLKGDANQQPDARSYPVTRADKVLVSVPELGRAIAWLSRTPGVFVLAGYAALMLALVLRRRAEPRDSDHHQGRGRRRTAESRPAVPRRAVPLVHRRVRSGLRARTIAAATTLGLLPALHAAPGWAAFTDTATIGGSTIGTATAATIPTTTTSCSTLNLLNGGVRINWTAMPGATGYTLYYGSDTARPESATTTTDTITGTISLGQAWVVVQYGTSGWVSPASNKVSFTILLGAVGTCG